MQKEEMIEELKRSVLRKVEYRESIPEYINEIVERCFNDLLELYKNYQCNSATIEEYIDGAKREVNASINRIGEDRKNIQFEEFQRIMNRMQREVEEKQIRNEQRDKQEISEVDFEDSRNSMRIMDVLDEALIDIQNRQNNILDARGYSYDRIEQISQEVRIYINNFEMRQEENVRYSFEQDKNELVSKIIQEYENYAQWEKSQEEKNEDERASFREELNAGISLEDQFEFVENRTNNEQEQEKEENEIEELPGDVIL